MKLKYQQGGYIREQNNHPVSFDTEGNLVDQVTGEKGTMVLPGLTVRGVDPKTRARNYSSAYRPENALEFLDIMTRPLTRPFSVSQQIGAIRNKINGGTYLGSLLGNKENLGIVSKNFNKEHPYLSTAANIGIDIFTPFGIKGINKGIQTGNRYYLARQIYKDINNSSLKSEQIPLNIGWGPKQTIPVSRASNSGNMQLFFPNRWDVVNEGANPHGIWFQGKLGYPRTDFTNPGKGEKAAKARALFANRPVQMQGNLTLEKPMITVGDVPNRSQLSYYADNAGADGLIYNGVYDNGYNNNQVILSFKKMNKTDKVGKNLLGNSSKKGFNYNDLPTEKYTYNNKTGNWDINAPKKEWVQKGENELVPDYFISPEEQQRLIASGLSPEEAAEIMQTRFTNSINARPGIFRNLGKNTYGESRISGGYAQPVYNNRKGVKASLNDAKTTLNTVFHELGGHGSSLNGELSSFKLDNPLVKIMMHNESLRPQLKPFYQAVKNGDFKLAEKLAPKDGSLKGINGTYDFKELQKFIKYMEENQEYSARAIGANMSKHYGMPNGWNEQQLREYFTEESVNNLLKNVWNYGMPLTIGGYNIFNQPQQQKTK